MWPHTFPVEGVRRWHIRDCRTFFEKRIGDRFPRAVDNFEFRISKRGRFQILKPSRVRANTRVNKSDPIVFGVSRSNIPSATRQRSEFTKQPYFNAIPVISFDKLGCIIGRATISYDNFIRPACLSAQSIKERTNCVSLVKDRDNYTDLHCRQSLLRTQSKSILAGFFRVSAGLFSMRIGYYTFKTTPKWP